MKFLRAKGAVWSLARIVLILVSLLCYFSAEECDAASYRERIANMAEVKGLRISTDSNKTRIVIDAAKDTEYDTQVISNPQRVIVSIHKAWLGNGVVKSTKVDSRFVKAVRIAQYDKDTVRVVVESSLGENNRKLFKLAGGSAGYRLVMDFGNLQASSAGAAIDFGNGNGAQAAKPAVPKDEAKPEGNNSTAAPVVEQNGSNKSQDSEVKPAGGKDKPAGEKIVVEPVFTPGLNGKLIAIDPGHGGCDVGAIGPTGVTEKSVTIRVAQEVQRQLIAKGARVVMTRSDDTEVSPKKEKASDIEELQARCDIANKAKADIFVSIHMDSFTNSVPSGTTGYYYSKGTKAGVRLSKCVADGVTEALSTGNRGNKSCNFYVVKHTDMPATLVEVAFISNEKEERLLNSEAGIRKAAAGIVSGLEKFFN